MAATTLVDRAVLRLSGEDVRGFLQGLVTNDVANLAPDRPLWAGLLTAQGKALFDFLLWADGEDVLIDCEAAEADALAKRLALYRLRRRIEIVRDESLAVHWSREDGGIRDPRLADLGRDQARAVRPQQQRLFPAGGFLGLHLVAHHQHVAHRDAFGDADHQVEVRLHGLPDRLGGACGRHVDHADGRTGLDLGVGHAGVDRYAFEILAGALRIHAGDEAGFAVGVVAAAARVELTGLAGDALRDHAGVLVDEDAHGVILRRVNEPRRRSLSPLRPWSRR